MSKQNNKARRAELVAQYQEQKRSMGVYQIKNEENGRIYIGSSTNLQSAWNKEQLTLSLGSHINKQLQQDWKDFGEQKFSFLILETVHFDQPLLYDYKDVLSADVHESAQTARNYKREVDKLKEKWMEKLQPFQSKGYH